MFATLLKNMDIVTRSSNHNGEEDIYFCNIVKNYEEFSVLNSCAFYISYMEGNIMEIWKNVI